MNVFQVLNFILNSKDSHFISVDRRFYQRWKTIVKMAVYFNKNYKNVEIFRQRFKNIEDFVVVGLKWSGKNVRRRTAGFAREFIEQNKNSNCIYCGVRLNKKNATADHIIPISKGGNNTQINLVVCCFDCNNERGNEDFRNYLQIKNPNYRGIKNPII